MDHLRNLVFLVLVCCGSSASAAVTWTCALSDDAMTLVCAADADAAGLQVVNAKPLVVVNGTEFPLNPQGVYVVPLYSPPTDMAFLDELAREAMCLGSTACKVVYAVPSLGRAIPERLRPHLAVRG